MGGIIRIPRALFRAQAQPPELCAPVRYYSAECQIVIELLQRELPQSKERILPLLHNPPKACFVALNAAFWKIRKGSLYKPKEKLSGSINLPRVFEAYLGSPALLMKAPVLLEPAHSIHSTYRRFQCQKRFYHQNCGRPIKRQWVQASMLIVLP